MGMVDGAINFILGGYTARSVIWEAPHLSAFSRTQRMMRQENPYETSLPLNTFETPASLWAWKVCKDRCTRPTLVKDITHKKNDPCFWVFPSVLRYIASGDWEGRV